MAKPSRDLDSFLAFERLDFVHSAQECIAQLNAKLGHQVRAFFFKSRVGRHVHLDVEVARHASSYGLTRALQADHLTTLYTSRYSYLDLFLFFVYTLAATGGALFFRDL